MTPEELLAEAKRRRETGEVPAEQAPMMTPDDLLAEAKRRRAESAQGSLRATQDMQPDQAAEVIDLSSRRGIDFGTAWRQRDTIKAAEQETATGAILSRSPKLTESLTDPRFAAVSRDSLEQLAEIEARIAGKKNAPIGAGITDAVSNALTTIYRGPKPENKAKDGWLENPVKQTGDLGRSFAAAVPQSIGSGLSGLGDLYNAYVEIGTNVVPGARKLDEAEAQWRADQGDSDLGRLYDAVAPYAGPGRVASQVGGTGKDIGEAWAPDNQGIEDHIIGGLGQILTTFLLSVASGGTSLASGMFLGMGADQQADAMRVRGIDPSTQPAALSAGAAVTGLSEMVRLNSIMKIVPAGMRSKVVSAALGRTAWQAGQEAVQEIGEGIGQNLITLGYDREALLFSGLLEQGGIAAASAGLFQMLIEISLPGKMRGSRAQDAHERMGNVRDAVDAAPVFQRQREAVRQFVENSTEGETVLLDDEGIRLMQQDDPEAFSALMQLLEVNDEQIMDAIENGNDIEIDASRLLTLPDRAQYDQLADIMRTEPDAMTMAEFRDQAEADANDIYIEELNARFDAATQALEGFEKVEGAVKQMLLEAGRSPQEAEAAGAVWGAVFRRLAEDGVNEQTIFDKLKLRVQGPQPKSERLPAMKEPQSLSQFIRAQGGIRERIGEGAEGELTHMAGEVQRITGGEPRGLLNNKSGRFTDDMVLAAQEAGFDVADEQGLLDALARDVGGEKVYANYDGIAWSEYQTAKAKQDEADAEAGAEVLTQAQKNGYAGTDIEGATEWEAARIKGLDMSTEARMARKTAWQAEKNTPPDIASMDLYHGTEGDFAQFTPSEAGTRGRGVYLTPDQNVANKYARPASESSRTISSEPGAGGAVMPVNVRGMVYPDESSGVMTDEEYKAIFNAADNAGKKRLSSAFEGEGAFPRSYRKVLANAAETNDGKNALLSVAGYTGRSGRSQVTGDAEVFIFDPKNIRSVNAAFDPDQSDSSNILAQPERKITYEAYSNPDLSGQENKAIEMHFNGWTRPEIEDEMEVSPEQLRVIFSRARKKGVDISMMNGGRSGAIRAKAVELKKKKLKSDAIAERIRAIFGTQTTAGSVDSMLSQERVKIRNAGGTPLFQNPVTEMLNASVEETGAWYVENVREISQEMGNGARSVNLHFKTNDSLEREDANVSLFVDVNGKATATLFLKGTLGTDKLKLGPKPDNMTPEQQAEREAIAKEIHAKSKEAQEFFARGILVLRHWVALEQPSAISFSGSGKGQDKLYNFILSKTAFEGYTNHRISTIIGGVTNRDGEISGAPIIPETRHFVVLKDGETLGDYTETESVKGRSGTDVDGNKWQGYHAVHAEEIGPDAVQDTSAGGMDGRDVGDSRGGTGDGQGTGGATLNQSGTFDANDFLENEALIENVEGGGDSSRRYGFKIGSEAFFVQFMDKPGTNAAMSMEVYAAPNEARFGERLDVATLSEQDQISLLERLYAISEQYTEMPVHFPAQTAEERAFWKDFVTRIDENENAYADDDTGYGFTLVGAGGARPAGKSYVSDQPAVASPQGEDFFIQQLRTFERREAEPVGAPSGAQEDARALEVGVRSIANDLGIDGAPFQGLLEHYTNLAMDEIDAGVSDVDTVLEAIRDRMSEHMGESLHQTAYHGTDAAFDKFDSSEIGSADGNQKFGWGFYFTNSKSVAQEYITAKGRVIKASIPNDEYLIKWEGDLNDQPFSMTDVIYALDTDGKIEAIIDELNESEDVPYSVDPQAQVEAYLSGENNLDDISDYATKEQLDRLLEMREFDSPADETSGGIIYDITAAILGSKKAASEFFLDIGVKGVLADDATLKSGDKNYVVFSADDIAILDDGESLFQDELLGKPKRETYGPSLAAPDAGNTTSQETLGQPRKTNNSKKSRAEVLIPGALHGLPGAQILSDREVVVRLTKAADKTSFMHESAHIFLELYAALESENENVAKRMAAIRKFLNLEPGQSLTRTQHEAFAEAFEAYLMEGNAPSAEMKGVFRTFKAWFTEVYSRLRGKLPNLNDEARDMFDRMLATDEEIEAARSEYGSVLTRAMAGIMSPELVEKYKDFAQKAGDVAKEKLFRKHMDAIKRRERAAYKADEARIEAEVRADVEGANIYRAIAEHPGLAVGTEADMLAPDYGFATGQELVDAMKGAKPAEALIKAETKRELDDLYGDLLTDGSAEMEAIEAVFNEPNIKMLEAERDALAEQAAKRPIPLGVIRARAQNMIDNTPIKEVVRPGTYALKARDLHKRAIRSAAAQKWDDALRYTHQAMLQHELARRAYKAQAEIATINRFLARFAAHRKIDPKKVNTDYIAQIRALMALPGADNQQGSMAEIAAFAAAEAAEGRAIVLPSAVMLGTPMPERVSMTMAQLREFRDGVKSLSTIGRQESEAERAAFKAFADGLAGEVESNWTGKTKTERRNPTFPEKTGEFLRYLDSRILRWPFLVEALQGGKRGNVIDALETGLRSKLTERNSRREHLAHQLAAIFKKHGISQSELMNRMTVKEIDALPVKFEQVLGVALNMGNDGNRMRIDGDPTIVGDANAVMAAIDPVMEKRHWDAVQETWDLINSLWPEASAVHKRATGVAPPKVDGKPFVTRHGTYQGGYYPISYDKELLVNEDLKRSELDDMFKDTMNAMSTYAQTKQGHLQARLQNVQRPLNLSLGVILGHIDQVTNDIYLREEAQKVSRILRNKEFRRVMTETHGKEYLEVLETVLKRTVVGTERTSDHIEGMFRTFRINAGIFILGYNLKVALLAPISYFQTVIPQYGFKTVLSGVMAFHGRGPIGTVKAWKFISEKSAFMRERENTLNREAHELLRKSPSQSRWARIQGAGYLPMTWIEKYTVSGPLWMGVYHDALARGDSDADAVAQADRAIATTQGSGLELDQGMWQGGNEFLRNLTFMYGYVSGYYGTIRNEVSKAQGIKKAIPIVKHMVILNIVAALMEALIRSGLGDDDDPYLDNVLKLMGRNTVGLVPGLSSAISRYDSGPAFMQFGTEAWKAVTGWQEVATDLFMSGEVEGDMVGRAAKSTGKAAGLGLGIPGGVQLLQIEKTMTQDDDPTLYEALITGPDKDN